MFVVGFTGTQEGMTLYQKEFVVDRLLRFKELYQICKAVHGYCIGADDDFGVMCMNQKYTVSIRPGCDDRGNSPKLGTSAFDEEFPPEPYLIRNHKIVDECDVLLACPKEMEEVIRSGTWATIRYARKIGKPVEIFYPRER